MASDLPRAFLGLPDGTAGNFIRLQRRLRLLAARTLLTHPIESLPGDLSTAIHTLRQQLTAALKSSPEPVLAAIGGPDVLPNLLLLQQSQSGEEAARFLRIAIPALLAAASGHSGVHLRWSDAVAQVIDCRHGRVLDLLPALDGLVATPDGLLGVRDGEELMLGPDTPGCRISQPFHRILPDHPRLHLSLIDSNPLSTFELHPDKEGNSLSLGGRPVDEWITSLRTALEFIAAALPNWWAEARHSMDRIVPVGYFPERHLSASYREAPGLVYASLCDAPMTMAEALIHETQHGKLNTLAWFDPVLSNAHDVWVESPVRPDRRPLWGVLLAAHAFVPVAAMYDRLAAQSHPISHAWARFKPRQAEVLRVNEEGMKTCQEWGNPTPAGARLIGEFQQLHTVLASRALEEGLVDAATHITASPSASPVPLRESYLRDGFVQGLDILDSQEAAHWRARLEAVESAERARRGGIWADRDFYPWRNPEHPLLDWVLELSQHPRLLQAVSSVLGPDLLIRNADIFIKEPHTSEQGIAWHWDSAQRCPSADGFLTAWLGLTPSTPENGGMCFIQGGHRLEIPDPPKDRHGLNFSETALKAIGDLETIDNRLEAGQASLHHAHMPHCSGLNESEDRRVALVIRFMTPSVTAEMAESGIATLVRGRDRVGHFELRPTFPVTWRAAIP